MLILIELQIGLFFKSSVYDIFLGIDDAVDILCDDEIWIDSLSCHENGLSCLLSYYCCYNHLFFSSVSDKYNINKRKKLLLSFF